VFHKIRGAIFNALSTRSAANSSLLEQGFYEPAKTYFHFARPEHGDCNLCGGRVAAATHDHVYERIKPQQGIQHFVSGAGGQLRRGNLNKPSQLTAADNDQVHSFMYVEITQNNLSFRAIDAEGRIPHSRSLASARR
jgi:hypothetical protein